MSIEFKTWSEKFKNCRKDIGNIEGVLNCWRSAIPTDWKRERWAASFGYRKNSKGDDRGEQVIERELLGQKGQWKLLKIEHKTLKSNSLISFYHNFPLAKFKSGQVIADAFGLVHIGKIYHPLVIEVKTNANDCWFALVENLQQIKMARANEVYLKTFLGKIHAPSAKGTWGLVVAPRSFYEKNDNCLSSCKKLLKTLKENTEARIAFAHSGKLEEDRIEIVCSNWE